MGKLSETAGTIGAIGSGLGAVAAVGGMLDIGGNRQRRKQVEQQEKLNNVNKKYAKEMADYENAGKLKMWEDTNYEAQLAQAEKAGVSKAAAIGGSGTGTQGASVSTPTTSADGAASMMQANSGKMMAGMQMMQMQLMGAQADKLQAEAERLRSGKGLDVATTEGQVIKNYVANATKEEAINTIAAEADKKLGEATSATVKGVVDNETQREQINRIKAEAAKEMLEVGLTEQKVNLTKAQINEIGEKLAQGWKAIEFQGLDKVTGKYVEMVADKILGLGGVNTQPKEHFTRPKK